MDSKKIGIFLRELRKEKGLTQAQLAEQLRMSDRTVSRWETGTTLPDLSVLVELADFYDVDIREIIDGERKSKKMNEETKEALVSAAQYAKEEKQGQLVRMKKTICFILLGFGCFLMMSAFAVFPSESGWGAKFAVLGALVAAAGVFLLLKKRRILLAAGVFVLLTGGMILMDFISVCYIGQAPRFAYLTEYGEGAVTYHAPFYTVVRHNPYTAEEHYEVYPGYKK